MAKSISLRQAKGAKDICSVRRDHYDFGDWTIMTDGHHVWISKQKVKHPQTDHIAMPKAIFDKMFDAYGKKVLVGTWHDEKFYPSK